MVENWFWLDFSGKNWPFNIWDRQQFIWSVFLVAVFKSCIDRWFQEHPVWGLNKNWNFFLLQRYASCFSEHHVTHQMNQFPKKKFNIYHNFLNRSHFQNENISEKNFNKVEKYLKLFISNSLIKFTSIMAIITYMKVKTSTQKNT